MTRDVLLESSTNAQKAGQSLLRSDLISLEKNYVRRLSVAKQVRTIIIIQKRTLFLLLEKYSAFFSSLIYYVSYIHFVTERGLPYIRAERSKCL